MKVVLDTNVYRALLSGDPGVARRLAEAPGIIVPVAVLAELLFGFRAGTRYTRNRAELDAFLGEPLVEVAPASMGTAEWYGRVAAALKKKGRPIPTNDVWIAATTFEHGAELLSFDDHFAEVSGLAWSKPD
jgi:predicted nucleic acid-binding protein